MKHLTFIVIALMATGCATWTKTDIAMESLYLATHVADYKQTKQVARQPDDYKEANFFIGSHPSETRVDNFYLLMGVSHILVSHYLKSEKRLWQQMTIGWELIMISNNYSVGLEVKF